jgi:hypothetical protein
MICQPIASACRCYLGNGSTIADQRICAGRAEPARCNCDSATCAEPLDSCGEQLCLGVCKEGDACDDPTVGSQADGESPHRLMTVRASGSVLSFSVTCPEGSAVFHPEYTRGFTAQGTELRLFQEDMIEIYERRL